VTLHYLNLDDYLVVASAITGVDVDTLLHAAKLNLADSALHAPQASFGGEEFYPHFVDKAAVLLTRLTKNHPLLDGNKRAAWVSFRLFIEMNEWVWIDFPSIDEAEQVMLAIASSDWDELTLSQWLQSRISPNSQ
jgi:death-on-curing protein